jgi:hypothetical protein
VNYIENRGRNRGVDEDAPNLKPKHIWEIGHRDHVKSYNRNYYLKSEAKHELSAEAEQTYTE